MGTELVLKYPRASDKSSRVETTEVIPKRVDEADEDEFHTAGKNLKRWKTSICVQGTPAARGVGESMVRM